MKFITVIILEFRTWGRTIGQTTVTSYRPVFVSVVGITALYASSMASWKRPWCWEGLGARGEGDDRGWDGWMALLTRWTWVWVSSGSWWWTGRTGVLRFMGLQRVGHDWATGLHWTDGCSHITVLLLLFSHQAASDSLQPHGLQHARLSCPSLSSRFAQTHVHWVSDAI